MSSLLKKFAALWFGLVDLGQALLVDRTPATLLTATDHGLTIAQDHPAVQVVVVLTPACQA